MGSEIFHADTLTRRMKKLIDAFRLFPNAPKINRSHEYIDLDFLNGEASRNCVQTSHRRKKKKKSAYVS